MDDRFDDYFNDSAEQSAQPQQPVKPVETEGEREERRLEEATIERSHNWFRTGVIAVVLLLVVAAVAWVWQLFWHPYSYQQRRGVITAVVAKGTIYKTYEATMLEVTYLEHGYHIDDTVQFSIAADSVAVAANMFAGNGKRVAVELSEYKARLPWRGESRMVATTVRADSI